jgi:hypothetical protein
MQVVVYFKVDNKETIMATATQLNETLEKITSDVARQSQDVDKILSLYESMVIDAHSKL